MHSKTRAADHAAFEKLYERVPADQIDRLRHFRLTHPYKSLTVDDIGWEYISCGQGDQGLLLLPGALSIGESMFPFISAFENEYRIIAPSYALSLGMAGLCDGIASILDAEGLQKVHVLGGSYGGLVAQYSVRRHPKKVRSLVLSHTFVLTSKYAKPLWIAGKLFPALPRCVLAPVIRLRLEKILLSTLRAAQHPELEFWSAYLNEAIASDLLKEVFVHQNKCLLTCAQQPQFTAEDLQDWPGRILIIESEDDPAIGAKERQVLKSIYPQAQVHTFHDAGHASSILKREEVFSIVRSFLRH